MTGSRDRLNAKLTRTRLGFLGLDQAAWVSGDGGAAGPSLMLANMRSLVATGCSKLLTEIARLRFLHSKMEWSVTPQSVTLCGIPRPPSTICSGTATFTVSLPRTAMYATNQDRGNEAPTHNDRIRCAWRGDRQSVACPAIACASVASINGGRDGI
jgi:hypothetical protein